MEGDEKNLPPKTADDLVKYITLLRKHINISLLLPPLLEQEALTSDEKHQLRLSNIDPKNHVSFLITDILPSKGDKGLEYFITILKKSIKEPGSAGHRYILENVFHMQTGSIAKTINSEYEDLNNVLINFDSIINDNVDANDIQIAVEHTVFCLCHSKRKDNGSSLLSREVKDTLQLKSNLTFLKLFDCLVECKPPLILPHDVSLLHKITNVLGMEKRFHNIISTLRHLVDDYEVKAAIKNTVTSPETGKSVVKVTVTNARCGSPQLKSSVKDSLLKALDEITFKFLGKDDGSVILYWEFQEEYFTLIQKSFKHACSSKIVLGKLLITNVSRESNKNQINIAMEIVDPLLLRFAKKSPSIVEILSPEHDNFVILLLSIINNGSSAAYKFLFQSKPLEDMSLTKMIEDYIAEQKLHWCDISSIQHFIYDVYEWSIYVENSVYTDLLRRLLVTIQDYEPACLESEDLPPLNLNCSINCATMTTVFLGINSVSFEVIMTLKYGLSRLLCLSILEFQCIKWEITQSGLNIDWQVPSQFLSRIDAVVQYSKSCGSLEIQEFSCPTKTSIKLTCCIQDSQLLLDGTPLLIPDLKGNYCMIMHAILLP